MSGLHPGHPLFDPVIRVGICRALDGVRFLPDWEAFLVGLGCEIVVSEPTTRQMVESGVRQAPAELCLPVKACVGHALDLQGRVDRLLLPRIVCRRTKEGPLFGCPKAIALPDMLRALIPDLPPIVEFLLDEREGDESRAYRELAEALGLRKRRAGGWPTEKWPREKRPSGPAAEWSYRQVAEQAGPGLAGRTRTPVVAVVGHDYLVDDDELSLGLLPRLAAAGAQVARGTPETAGVSVISPGFEPDWLFERELIWQALGWASRLEVDGLLLATSFACGTSAVTNDIIRRAVRRHRPELAVLELVFDEQTGPAGLTTRLESFVELLRMRR